MQAIGLGAEMGAHTGADVRVSGLVVAGGGGHIDDDGQGAVPAQAGAEIDKAGLSLAFGAGARLPVGGDQGARRR